MISHILEWHIQFIISSERTMWYKLGAHNVVQARWALGNKVLCVGHCHKQGGTRLMTQHKCYQGN